MSEGQIPPYWREQPMGSMLLPASDVFKALERRSLDPQVRQALIAQLEAWVRLADFAKWLSVGLAIGSGLLSAFLLAAMTWDDLFAGSGLWEFSLLLFALAVFVASPLAIFVLGRPLKGIDEWSPALSRDDAG
jgi:hypothetical protein